MAWWILLGILIILAVLPLGVSMAYDAAGAVIRLILGPIRITLVPGKKKEKKPETPEKTRKKPEKQPKEQSVKQIGKAEPDPKPQAKEQAEGGSLLDFLPLVKTLFDFLGDFRRKLRLDRLELKLTLAGGDPADLAVNYGRAWAALGNLLPKLEQWFVIKKRDLEVQCDFAASETVIFARLDLTITLGRLLAAIFRFAFRALKEYLKINKKRKGGAKQ